jgi:hypothetical protein
MVASAGQQKYSDVIRTWIYDISCKAEERRRRDGPVTLVLSSCETYSPLFPSDHERLRELARAPSGPHHQGLFHYCILPRVYTTFYDSTI